ncbi:UDP-N-acetylglucosamine--N-acetylmuramyl-(pentapeptide) pyrophosphoryl-undecaprenol N-acetylglucosamine transferase [Desulfamplus magnetovallimortis]|uniref:UDP-N-acetylglucosamine--N-acetylmuramyl- (pentapeptide) pyrophosphoryl-undecaprenol N-acetylglucosamine transferase n=1 Tax=Desulfamplus magnetovallimortis TaxID=1246637 RepID=UPI00164942E2|nr:UDP-N-acetylglucosamine--N-acetylmuramyl-(pentapeptide) pyrophosphoryl-undecaprenol N-acetylglucosamine transferase [Desulfamplus magnetovallimortis]
MKFIIAGGKTGGHLFPGIAIAQAILRLEQESQILFVGTGAPFETKTLDNYGFKHKKIISSGIKGKGIFQKITALLQIPVSVLQAIKIIINFKPDMVIGVGGFSSGSVLLGAKLCGIKTAIHEQNSIAGITNRILSRVVDIIFTSFQNTKGFEHKKSTLHTGNPIRQSVNISKHLNRCQSNSGKTGTSEDQHKNIYCKKFTILVTGGSQGAKSINSAFVDAVTKINFINNTNFNRKVYSSKTSWQNPSFTSDPKNKEDFNGKGKYKEIEIEKQKNRNNCNENSLSCAVKGYHIIHQTGSLDEERIIKEYEKFFSSEMSETASERKTDNFHNKITAKAFFHDMPQIMAISDLVICRSGAGTLSEITALGKPSLLVPYPHAADDHQTFNALSLVNNEAAWMINDRELSPDDIIEKITLAYENPELMKNMSANALKLGHPHADETIAQICINVANDKKLLF